MKHRKLFCEISPLTYYISTQKAILARKCSDFYRHSFSSGFSLERTDLLLPVSIYRHNSLIRRQLGNVDMQLQENKATNLALACKQVNGVIIRPGETFSFWKLVGPPNKQRGFREGLTISNGKASSGIGGGLCQFTNLIHWMILHSDLTIVEHHHHDGIDLFPDFNRQIPFGTGTSILYNYLDYRFKNETSRTYQIMVSTNERYLCGKLLCDQYEDFRYHICCEDEYFSREGNDVYRNSKIYRLKVDPVTGNIVEKKLIRKNHAKVAYDTDGLVIKNSDG